MSDANRTQDLEVPKPYTTLAQGLWLVGLLVGTVVLLSLGGEWIRLLMQYDRVRVLDAGEYWRLVTGHLVHGSSTHMALNVAGLGVLAALFPRHYSLLAWLLIGACSLVAIDLGFVLYEPQLEWYVGLSGVLHGGLAAGAIAWWRYESRAFALALSLILIGKLTWEQTQGALPLSGDMSVIVDAHLYGAIGGGMAGIGIWYGQHGWPRHARSL